jgi:hypothetical protein
MLDQLVNLLVDSKNQAADDVLLEALRLGTAQEKSVSLAGLMRRRTVYGLGGVVRQFSSLPESIQNTILSQIGQFHPALREGGRHEDLEFRKASLKLIALGRQGKLAYILSENLHDPNEDVSKTAVESLVALARWVATETRRRQSEPPDLLEPDRAALQNLLSNRPEIESAVARALDVHRGRWGSDLLRAALLLCDHPASKTLAILQTTKHGGQGVMVRRLQQPPASEHVEAYLLAASHGQVRSHFGTVFSHINEPPVLDAILRKTHWLKDHQLQLCVHQVTKGVWWDDDQLAKDLQRRRIDEIARIAEWIGASGVHDVVQDQKLERLLAAARNDPAVRLRILRVAQRRRRGSSVAIFKAMLNDPDERLMRMAARELVRRRPPDMENLLLQQMTTAPESVRRVISRSIGQSGFEHFWQRFDRIDRPTRRQAGRAMLKLLPDAAGRAAAQGDADRAGAWIGRADARVAGAAHPPSEREGAIKGREHARRTRWQGSGGSAR